jgi:hypothetical protein
MNHTLDTSMHVLLVHFPLFTLMCIEILLKNPNLHHPHHHHFLVVYIIYIFFNNLQSTYILSGCTSKCPSLVELHEQ